MASIWHKKNCTDSSVVKAEESFMLVNVYDKIAIKCISDNITKFNWKLENVLMTCIFYADIETHKDDNKCFCIFKCFVLRCV